MFKMHSAWRVTAKAALAASCFLFSSSAQLPMATYVCQTPAFWCAVNAGAGVRNGTACYCSTVRGPVVGYSIDPSGVSNAPTLPTPQQPQPQPSRGGGRQTPGDSGSGSVGSDDCYKGLGNCPGSFMKAASGGGNAAGARGSSKSGFAGDLQRLIDAAHDGFDSVQGDARKSSSSSSDRYDVTITPDGMDFCTLFIRTSGTRRWVSCFAPDEMTYTQLRSRVAQALGPAASSSSDGQVWKVDGVKVETSRDPVSFDITPDR